MINISPYQCHTWTHILLCCCQLSRLSQLEAELSLATQDKAKLLREADAHNNKVSNTTTTQTSTTHGDVSLTAPAPAPAQVEALQSSALSLEADAQRLRSQLHAVTQEKLGHAQEVTELQRKLQEAHHKVRLKLIFDY